MTQVLACIDASAAALPVCDYAAWASLRLDAPLTLLHVLDEARYPSEPNLSGNLGIGELGSLQKELSELDQRRNQLALEQGQALLEVARQRVISNCVGTPSVRQRHGDLVDSLRDLQNDTRLLVIGKQGEAHPQSGAHIGDNVERVMRSMQRPILIAAGEFRVPQTVLLAFDGSATMDKAIEMLAGSPLLRDLAVHVATVGPETDAQNEAAEKLRVTGHQATVVNLGGNVEEALHGYQQEHNIDMVAMGAYGHSRIREFLVGSTTKALIRGATVPHLVLR